MFGNRVIVFVKVVPAPGHRSDYGANGHAHLCRAHVVEAAENARHASVNIVDEVPEGCASCEDCGGEP